MDIFSGLLYAKCLTENMIWTVSYILKSSVSTQFSNTKINKQKKKKYVDYDCHIQENWWK